MRTFGQVPLALWNDARFVALSGDARLALLYLWCGPHSTTAGVYVLRNGYAALDLGWEPERWRGVLAELVKAQFAEHDAATGTILVNGFFAVNRPSNARHHAAIANRIAAVPCADLRAKAQAAYDAVCSKETEAPVSTLPDAYLRGPAPLRARAP